MEKINLERVGVVIYVMSIEKRQSLISQQESNP